MSQPDSIAKKLAALKYQGDKWDVEFYRNGVYSEALLKEYLDDLKIESPEGRKKMEDSILFAAMYYESAKKSHILSYRTPKSTQSNIRKLKSDVERFRKDYVKIVKDDSAAIHAVMRSFQERVAVGNISPQAKRYVEAMLSVEAGKSSFDIGGFIGFLDFYLSACESAIRGPISENAAHKSYPLETWLQNLDVNWKQYSKIHFIEGKHYKGIGYNSDAVDILMRIMEPLDSSVKKIAVANKLKELNKKCRS